MQLLIGLLLFLLVFTCLGCAQRRRQRQKDLLRLKAAFGKASEKQMSAERYARVPSLFLRRRPALEIDDITWNDLEMDHLFHRMDSTMSAAGEEYLYALLRSASGETAIPRASVRYWEEDCHSEERAALQLSLRQLGHTGAYSLYDYLELLEEAPAESNLRHLPAWLLPALSVLLMRSSVRIGILCLIGSFVLNTVTYYRRKGEIEPYIAALGYLLRVLRCGRQILGGNGPVFEEERQEMRRLLAACADMQRGSWVLLSGTTVSGGNPLDFLMDYLRILFHLDLICFNSMLKRTRAHSGELDRLMQLLGRMDAAVALASYEKSLPYTCEPQISEEKPLPVPLKARALYHPLLLSPVANDVEAERSMLLTGSNASGKSTFLKAVALCALLAQTAGFCPAAEYQGRRFDIFSSMALRDNLLQGESYFMVEIRSLKRIFDRSAAGRAPVLCVVDEVLRGTNTVERIAASSEILQTLARADVLCLAATHDVELTTLLAEDFDNFHFEEEFRGEDISFSYLLKKGPAVTRNAIRLLGIVGYAPAVVEAAAERAERFDADGRWS